MYQTALLLLTGPIRLVVESIGQYLNKTNKKVLKRLYVKLEPEYTKPFTKADSKTLAHLSSAVPIIYNKASTVSHYLDVRVLLNNRQLSMNDNQSKLNFDVIMTNCQDEDSRDNYLENYFNKNCNIIKLDSVAGSKVKNEAEENQHYEFSTYQTVCLGGTFDRLHNGHKVLLSEAVLRAKEKLIVGVSDYKMIKKKILWELIEPIEKRMENVKNFLLEIDPSLSYDIVPISDPFGPTITEPYIDCIVVTTETKLGGEKVNLERKKKDMSELSMIVVDVVENSDRTSYEEEKISSSTNRMLLLGTPLKSIQAFPNQKKPHCILFQGHFMSGKSFIANQFQLLGMPVLCCDEIMRAIINKDEHLRKEIAEKIMNGLSPEKFDFEKLTLLCLQNKENKELLAELLHSKIKISLQQVLKVYAEQGASVVLVKDSTILEGYNLEIDFNEIWAAVIPTSEALNKLKEIYNIPEEEASQITECFPPNEKYVEVANILFCNMWSTDAIKAQVNRAWLYVKSIKESFLPNML